MNVSVSAAHASHASWVWRCIVLALAIVGTSVPSHAIAQVRPTQGQVDVLANAPVNAQRVRDELAKTGMTQAQIRARLAEMGYAAWTLDPFLPGTTDTTAVATPAVFAVVRALTEAGDSRRAAASVAKPPSAPSDSGFAIFGQNTFLSLTTQFDANLSAPVDDNYRLGPGDQLSIVLTGEVNKAYSPEVMRDGFILFDDLGGPLYVANVSKLQVERQVLNRLAQAHSTLRSDNRGTTRMLFSIAKQGVKAVRVMGDVTVPGQYTVPNSATMISALYQAGGPTETGSWRRVQLRRGSQLIATFDVYDFLTAGNSANDFRVESGDVVFVPPRGGRVRLAGAVLRPMTYELAPGETLRDLIRLGGGLTASADRRRIQIERIIPPAQRTDPGRDRKVFDVLDPALVQNGSVPATVLEPDDIVRVHTIAARITGQVIVSGNVWSGGAVAFAPGMRLSTALARAGGVKPDTYLGQVKISRLRGDSTRVTLRAGLRDTLGNPMDDIELADADEIEVFSLTSFRLDRYVEIDGRVARPGRYPYREGMTLRDLTMLAGGPAEGALLTEAELSRLPSDRANGTLSVITKVPLDSLYLFDRSLDGRYIGPPGVQTVARAPETILQPFDHVLILAQPDWSLHRVVTITGEVRYPGRYTLRNKDERLSDLLLRAGGLRPEADSSAVLFIRAGLGRVGVNIDSVLRNPRHIDNLLMVEGDSVAIPAYSGVVSVRGAVNTPVALAYVKGADINYYIRAAGGPSSSARTRRSFVTQPNGKIETVASIGPLVTSKPIPRPGSIVQVPTKDAASAGTNWAGITSTAVSVLGSLVAMLAIVRR